VNIVVLCPHFAPDVAPTGEVMTSIADALIDRGHRMHVVTSLPWYQQHALEPGWDGQLIRHQTTAWGAVTRVHPFPTDKRNIPARAVAFGGFTALATFEGIVSRFTPDVVLAMSPPLTLGLAGWAVAMTRRVPFVFNIQDVFPDVAVELGLLTGKRAIAAASWLERLSYRRADAVTVLSDDLADNVRAKIARGLPPATAATQEAKVRVIPNFIDTAWITPGARENRYRSEYGLVGKRVVMYAGNVGLSQSLDLVLDAAAALRHEPDVAFVINGGGAARPELERRARGLDNLQFVDMQPKARLPEVLAAGDVHVVPLKRGLAWSSVPSKLYSILAAGRPIVASVDPGTEVERTVEQAKAGLAVPPDDAEAFTKAIRRLLDDPGGAAAMGASGRRFVETWASPAAVGAAYEALITELRDLRSRRRD
jgi:colanic acid biosynthesis glycosyl transferase WcaI